MSASNKDKPSLYSSDSIKEGFALCEPSKRIKERKAAKERDMSNADMGASEVLLDPTVGPGPSVGDNTFSFHIKVIVTFLEKNNVDLKSLKNSKYLVVIIIAI